MADQESLPTAELTKRCGHMTLKQLYSFVGETLDEAGIPNVMFGHAALCCFGPNLRPNGMDFVVADGRVPDAISALTSVGFARGTGTCPFDSELERAPCAGHVLVHRTSAVHLFEHSDVLWRVPCLDPPEEGMGPDKDIMHASHESLPDYARWPADVRPVRIPSLHRIFEACILKWIQGRGGVPAPEPDWEGKSFTLFWQRCNRIILSKEDNLYQDQLRKQLLPPSHLRWMEWRLIPVDIPAATHEDGGFDFAGFACAFIDMTLEEDGKLFRDSMLEEAEFQASKAKESQKAETE